jgi:hypothetical protein
MMEVCFGDVGVVGRGRLAWRMVDGESVRRRGACGGDGGAGTEPDAQTHPPPHLSLFVVLTPSPPSLSPLPPHPFPRRCGASPLSIDGRGRAGRRRRTWMRRKGREGACRRIISHRVFEGGCGWQVGVGSLRTRRARSARLPRAPLRGGADGRGGQTHSTRLKRGGGGSGLGRPGKEEGGGGG